MKTFLSQIEQILRGSPSAGGTPVNLLQLLLCTLICGAFYGGCMGTFGGASGEHVWQVVVSGVKVPLLLLATFALSLPSFFVLNTLLGLRSDFPFVFRALVSSQATLTIILATLAPYTMLWYASFESYPWAILFNALMFALASFTAQGMLRHWYNPLRTRTARHRWLLRLWLVLYAFVGIQMGWILRPFIGEPNAPVQWLRKESWGNAYVIVGRMIWDSLAR